VALVLSLSLFSANISAKERSKDPAAVVVKGDGKVKYVEANGRRLECLSVKTSWFKQHVSCEEMAQTLNPQTGKREGDWAERRLGLAESTTTAGDIVPVLVGGVLSPLITRNGMIRSAQELHCGAECGDNTTINNHLSSENTNTTTVTGPTIGVNTNVDVRLPCTGSCPPGG